MLSTLLSILYGLICLAILIFVHELGHMLAAKACGVKVTGFSIGFGPVLCHKKIGDTDYRISAIPLGGYCEMKGEKDFQKAIEENLDYIPKAEDSFYGYNPFKRVIIAFAGPFANIVFAFIAFTIISMVGYSYYTASAKVLLPDVEGAFSPAKEAGILDGDVITKINDFNISDFSDIIKEISIRPNENIKIEVDRNGKIFVFDVKTIMNKETGSGYIGVRADTTSIIKKEAPTYSFFPAMWHGITETGAMIGNTFKSLKVLFMGVDVTEAVSGPARISSILGDAAKEGFGQSFKTGIVGILQLMALISISLFIMNLLPIPVLDGGHIVFALIEAIFKKSVPPKVQLKIQYIGFVIIALIFIIGLTGDVKYFINKFRTH